MRTSRMKSLSDTFYKTFVQIKNELLKIYILRFSFRVKLENLLLNKYRMLSTIIFDPLT